MKKLIKTKIKKAFSSILPLTFLFVTICSGNIAHAAFSAVTALPDSTDAALTDISSGGTRNFTGYNNSAGSAGGKGTLAYDNSSSTLTLTDIDITTTNGVFAATGTGTTDVLTVKLVGDNKITSSKETIKVTSGSIKFTGDGSLTITQNTAGSAISTVTAGNIEFAQTGAITITQSADAYAISSAVNLTMASGNLTVKQSGNAQAVFIGGTGNTTGGTLTIIQTAAHGSLVSTGAFTQSGGNIVVTHSGDSAAVNFSSTFTMSGGSLAVTQSADKNAVQFTGAFSQTGGSITTTNSGASGSGLYFSDTAQFNGGKTSATSTTSSDDIIYGNNQAITVNGGRVYANSSVNSDYGITASFAAVTITRGVVEGYANVAGIDTDNLVLGDYTWTVYAGNDKDSAKLLTQTSAADVVSALKAGGYDYVRIYNAYTLAPATSVFDKNTAAKEHTEITVGLDLNGNKLTGISRGSTALTSGTEFHENIAAGASDPSSVTFQVREFLDTLPVGTHTLTFTFDNSTTADFTLEVVDTTNSAGSTQTGNTAQSEGPNQAEDKTQSGNVPKTGDESNIMLYIMLLTAGLFSLVLASKKKLFSK